MLLVTFLKNIYIPHKWVLSLLILTGVIFGIIFYAFYVSRAYSYLSDSPTACVNCHVMAPQYASWNHSSHRERASCNECHVPQDNFLRHYFFKAMDGLKHSTIFTARLEPQVIRIKSAGAAVVRENCLRCHQHANYEVMFSTNTKENQKRPCWDCHRDVPHGRPNSLAIVPGVQVPLPENPVPQWLRGRSNE